jgi:hypothetical protein
MIRHICPQPGEEVESWCPLAGSQDIPHSYHHPVHHKIIQLGEEMECGENAENVLAKLWQLFCMATFYCPYMALYLV